MGVVVGRRVAAAGVALALAWGLVPSGVTTPEPAQAAVTKTSSVTAEARKMAAVPTPKLSWSKCVTGAECATVKVPLDYDKPKGAKVELALLRVKARDRKNRIGTLFVNPGGPGGSSVDLALASPDVLSAKVRDRFDVVGVDPRGIGYGTPVSCFSSTRAQNAATAGYTTGFPLGAKQEKAWVAADKKLGKACSGDTLARSMSTAQVARDMELMRRAVGDKKLSYLGFSYGTYLGQVYANMFPSKVRAVAVDGVIDPVAWAGSKANAAQPLEWRLNSSGGAWKALREVLVRCDKAGTSRCSFAAGDPVAKTATIAARLKARPLVVEDQDGDEVTVTYAYLVSALLGELYDPAGYESVTDLLTYVDALTTPARSTTARSRTSGAERARTSAALVGALRDAEADRPRWGYDNSLDAFTAVTCTDSRETTKGSQYAGWATKADRRAPYFGRRLAVGLLDLRRRRLHRQRRGRLHRSVHRAHRGPAAVRRQRLRPGHQLRRGGQRGQADARRPAAAQPLLRPHRLRHLALRHRRRRRLPAQGDAAEGGHRLRRRRAAVRVQRGGPAHQQRPAGGAAGAVERAAEPALTSATARCGATVPPGQPRSRAAADAPAGTVRRTSQAHLPSWRTRSNPWSSNSSTEATKRNRPAATRPSVTSGMASTVPPPSAAMRSSAPPSAARAIPSRRCRVSV